MFRLLGLHPGPDVAARRPRASPARPTHRRRKTHRHSRRQPPEHRALTHRRPTAHAVEDAPRSRRLLELVRANLLTEHAPGRYTFHDLLRAYAAEQVEAVDAPADRLAAQRRVLDHYLHTAYAPGC